MFLDRVKKSVLLFDGAMGTYLQAKGLKIGDCPEEWNVTHPEVLKEIYKSYYDAGSDCIETNSFGATKVKLAKFGKGDKVYEFNKKAVELAKAVCPTDKFVFGAIGPTGEILEPFGDFTHEECYDNYAEQITALKDAGCEGFCIETMMDIEEAKIALKVVKDKTILPVIVSFTFQQTSSGYKTIMGNSIAQIVEELVEGGVDIIGSNCGNGIENMIEIVKEYKTVNKDMLIFVQPNAGLPEVVGDKVIYRETPEIMKPKIQDLLNIGVNVFGGCCGTTPDHIKVFRQVINNSL
jgi:5-methyltetrahydrofolate--homocysteine methyltransferase